MRPRVTETVKLPDVEVAYTEQEFLQHNCCFHRQEDYFELETSVVVVAVVVVFVVVEEEQQHLELQVVAVVQQDCCAIAVQKSFAVQLLESANVVDYKLTSEPVEDRQTSF
jgi:hypothetical protein